MFTRIYLSPSPFLSEINKKIFFILKREASCVATRPPLSNFFLPQKSWPSNRGECAEGPAGLGQSRSDGQTRAPLVSRADGPRKMRIHIPGHFLGAGRASGLQAEHACFLHMSGRRSLPRTEVVQKTPGRRPAPSPENRPVRGAEGCVLLRGMGAVGADEGQGLCSTTGPSAGLTEVRGCAARRSQPLPPAAVAAGDGGVEGELEASGFLPLQKA
uniref:Uncharacterized protein n=1 Tax=Myotis myotis TaxID=51298 RepID=A0A7J7SC63_MYOMY|nr:hypothetical protein mMyoMyo1_009543 [Myotis myotis]